MLQAWRVAHPPVRGHPIFFSRPLVHVGFLQSWLAGGFNTKVVNRIMQMVNQRQPGPNELKVYITGGTSLLFWFCFKGIIFFGLSFFFLL